jgi:uncharacterized membrane protein (UPF0127 family)
MTLRSRLTRAGALLGLACGLTLSSAAQTPPLLDLATFAQSSVEIGTSSPMQHFDVWIANSPEEQTQGLMFVRDLPANRGMLFLEPQAREMAFWMKNTYIELDMLFVAPNHRILKIAPRTHPLSQDLVHSDGAVIAVLEIKGGEAERRGLHVGDHISWR